MHKTNISNIKIKEFINNKFGKGTTFEKINSGEFSQAIKLNFKNKNLILRLNSNNDLGFKKDKIVSNRYSHIKSAKILEIGKFDENTFFAVSEKLKGVSIKEMSNEKNKLLLPSLFKNLNCINLTQIEGKDFGNWYSNLNGQFINWKERMDTYVEKDRWQDIKKKSKFINLNILDDLYKNYLNLLIYIPKERYFLHGDFGRSNIFAEFNKITGIIDWSESMYGDFLWDICWIAFWLEGVDFIKEYYQYNKNNHLLNMNNFEYRIKLYTIVNAIHHLIFAADRNDEKTYEDVIKIIKKF